MDDDEEVDSEFAVLFSSFDIRFTSFSRCYTEDALRDIQELKEDSGNPYTWDHHRTQLSCIHA